MNDFLELLLQSTQVLSEKQPPTKWLIIRNRQLRTKY